MSDTLFEAAEKIRRYHRELPHCYDEYAPIIDALLAQMDGLRVLLDTPPEPKQ